VTFTIDGTLEDAKRFLERCEIMSLAESLGGVETLIEHPALMTHASIPAEIRQQLGISDTLIRLSVGIEDAEDLVNEVNEDTHPIGQLREEDEKTKHRSPHRRRGGPPEWYRGQLPAGQTGGTPGPQECTDSQGLLPRCRRIAGGSPCRRDSTTSR